MRWHVDDVDAALRHVARALLAGTDASAVAAQGDPAPARAALDYLRQRVGVPRDMDYEAARQFRAYLTWAMDALA